MILTLSLFQFLKTLNKNQEFESPEPMNPKFEFET